MKNLIYLIFSSVLIVSCEFSVTTAKLSDSKVCGDLNSTDGCADDVLIFEEVPDTIFAVSKLINAPKGTEVRYYWYQFLDEDFVLLDSISYKSQNTNELLHSHIATSGLPLGKYRVVTRIIADNRDQIVKDFELAIPEGISMGMSRIGNSVNEFGKVNNVKANLGEEDRTVYFSSFLYNLPAKALINIQFKDMSDGKIVKELTINNGDQDEEAILLRANLNRDQIELNPGYHQIIINVEGESFTTSYIIL